MAINIKYVFIKKEYFIDHPDLVELIDPISNVDKLSKCTHIHIKVEYEGYTVYIPMRKFINIPKFGKIGFQVPSANRPMGGLDYRKILMIDNPGYIQELSDVKVARSQINIIEQNHSIIQEELSDYISGYIDAYNTGDIERSAKYRYSTLKNYNSILGLSSSIQ